MPKDFAKKFYKSEKWQKVRIIRLKMDNYLCVRCGDPAEEVHHKIHLRPDNIHDAAVTLDVDQLESLCRDCHFREHDSRDNKYTFYSAPNTEAGYAFNENGELVQVSRVHIVSGCIGSGKTAYVKQNMQYGDMVVDLDYIYSAISFQPVHDKPPNLLEAAQAVTECLYKLIQQSAVHCNSKWVVTTLKDYKLLNLINRLNARHIPLPSDRPTCIARVMADPTREASRRQDLELIDKWFGSGDE